MKISPSTSIKAKSFVVIIISFILSALVISCSCHHEDEMDAIKAFKPEDEYFKASMVALHFMMETYPPDQVDTHFRQLIESKGLPVDPSGIKDGIYTGSSPKDAFDYKHVVEIRIEGGKIVEVDYNEVKFDGHGKQEDEEYCEKMMATGTSPAIAYPHMEEKLLATQNMLEVDGVSGATYSLHRFRYAVTVALMKALI